MVKNLTLKKDDGKEEKIDLKDLDFINVLCDLEDEGVNVYEMTQGDSYSIKDIRTIFAAIIGEKDQKKAGSIMSEHMRNGGDIGDIFNVFMGMMTTEGFGNDPTPNQEKGQK